MKTPVELINKIKDELVEDLSRYDDDYETWSRIVLDCPSDTLDNLLGQIPEDDYDRMYENVLHPFIRSLGD